MKQINVLWIDDQNQSEDCKTFRLKMSRNGIKLIPFQDWETGKKYLINHRDEISAIVLDCYCKLNSNDIENPKFLKNVISEIEGLTTKYGKLFPWFILSAGNKENFSTIMEYSVSDSRERWDKDWKQVYYSKFNIDNIEKLYSNILNVATLERTYKIREVYKDVFDILDSDNFENGSSSILLKILRPLHYSDEQAGFDSFLHYNQLRQFVEKMFKTCYNQGLLPDECFKGESVNLWESYNYLSGNDLKHNNIRYGEKGESVLPDIYSKVIGQILFVSNEFSHSIKSEYVELTDEETTYVRRFFEEIGTSYFLFGYALQLCDIVIWLDKYIREHDFKSNRAKIKRLKKSCIEDYKDKTFTVSRDENGNLYCGESCILFKNLKLNEGDIIRPKEVRNNTNLGTNKRYLFICLTYEKEQ